MSLPERNITRLKINKAVKEPNRFITYTLHLIFSRVPL